MMGINKCKLIILCFLMVMMSGFKTYAAEYKKVSGTLKYNYAFEVLNLVNSERQKEGVEPLEMDKSLLDDAMKRAAETTVEFSHVRPNGLNCFSINNKIYGENIACGQSSPEDVMHSWMNSSGHKANIMSSRYNSIGVGCIKSDKGLYWVQVFGIDKADEVSCPKNKVATYKVSLNSSVETGEDENNNYNTVSEDDNASVEDTSKDDINVKPQKIKGLKVNLGKKKITMKWKDNKDIAGYQVQVSENKKYHNPEKYYLFSSNMNIRYFNGKRLTSHKKYYVRIRSFTINSQGLEYSKWKKITVRTR